jgi:hypothetical protein
MKPLTNFFTNGVAGFMEDLSLVRIPPWWQSPWFLLLVLALVVALGLWGRRIYLLRQLKAARRPTGPVAPGELPHLIALRQLEELRQRLDELGAYRLMIEASWVLRRYLEARFELRIVYQTTREFLRHAQTHAALAEAQRQSLGHYLKLCDLVKFARRGASREEMVQLLDYAVAFVQTCAQEGGAGPAAAAPAAGAIAGSVL